MKRIFKQIFILSIISFIFLIPLIYALDPKECAKGSICKRINHWSGTENLEDSEHGLVIDQACYNIINKDSSKDYFIPINSVSEFNAFKAAAPSLNVEVSVCASASSSVTSCTKCADEGGTCSFFGTLAILYGSGTTFYDLTLTGGTPCTNTVFGDPTPGVVKACYYCSATTTTTHRKDNGDIDQTTSITTPINTCQSCSQGTPIPITSPLWMAVETSAVAYQQAQAAGSTQPDAQTIADAAMKAAAAADAAANAAAAAAKANPTSSPTSGAGMGPGQGATSLEVGTLATPLNQINQGAVSSIPASANPTSSPTAGAGMGPGPSSTLTSTSTSSDPVASTLCRSCSTSKTGTSSRSENVAAATGQVSPVTSTPTPSSSSETASAATQQQIANAMKTAVSASDYASSSSSNDVGASGGGRKGGGGGGGGSVSLPLMKYATK